MAGKNFWNWIGLPSLADITAIKDSCLNREQQLAVIAKSNEGLLNQIKSISTFLSEQFVEMEKQLTALDHTLTSIIKKLSQAEEQSSQNCATLSNVLSQLRLSIDSLGTEKKVQFSELASQNRELTSGIKNLMQVQEQISQHSAKQSNDLSELKASISLMGTEEKTQFSQLIAQDEELLSKFKDLMQSQEQISKYSVKLSDKLSKLRIALDAIGTEEKAQLSQLVFNSENQNELLRLLVTNSLMDELAEFK